MTVEHTPGHCCGCERPMDGSPGAVEVPVPGLAAVLRGAGPRVEKSAEALGLGAVAEGPWHRMCLLGFIAGQRGVRLLREIRGAR